MGLLDYVPWWVPFLSFLSFWPPIIKFHSCLCYMIRAVTLFIFHSISRYRKQDSTRYWFFITVCSTFFSGFHVDHKSSVHLFPLNLSIYQYLIFTPAFSFLSDLFPESERSQWPSLGIFYHSLDVFSSKYLSYYHSLHVSFGNFSINTCLTQVLREVLRSVLETKVLRSVSVALFFFTSLGMRNEWQARETNRINRTSKQWPLNQDLSLNRSVIQSTS